MTELRPMITTILTHISSFCAQFASQGSDRVSWSAPMIPTPQILQIADGLGSSISP